jgi:predicted TIM-barrel fold metal-dependent hydrolase
MRARGDLSDRVLDKILGENAKTLYQL